MWHNLLLLLFVVGCATQPRFDGPLPVRNQHPAQLTVLHMDPAGATPVPAGEVRMRADASYTSLFLGGAGGFNTFEMDGEILRAGLKTTIGLGRNLTLGVELPIGHSTGGFLDSFIIDWHDFWGLPDQNRDRSPKNDFLVRAEKDGVLVHHMQEETVRLMDLPMSLTWTFVPVTAERPYGVGVRAAIEWPTGHEDSGFGNGEIDAALGLVGEYREGIVALTGHVQHTFAGTPDRARRGGLEFRDVTSIGLGGELSVTDTWSVLVQTEAETSTLRDLGFDRVDDVQWLLWAGVRARLAERVAVEFGLAEDLSTFIAPDFTLYLGVALDLGGIGGTQ